MGPSKVPIIQKHKLCGKRDKTMSRATMGRPVFDDDAQKFVCKKVIDGDIEYNFREEPCIGTTEDTEQMYCIPKASYLCPVTSIEFIKKDDGTIVLETSTDPIKGLPIIDVALSQQGRPCFDTDSFNSDQSKSKNVDDGGYKISKLMSGMYDKGCP